MAAAFVMPLAQAQSAKFPSRQIRIVVPFAPGGLTDAYARLYGEQLTQQLGAVRKAEPKTPTGSLHDDPDLVRRFVDSI